MSTLMAFRHLIISSDFCQGRNQDFSGLCTKEKGNIPKKRKGFSETNSNPTEKMNKCLGRVTFFQEIPPRNTYYYANTY